MTDRAPALAVVEAYMGAVGSRDAEGARRCLADTGFRFVSPLRRYDDPDSLIEEIVRAGTIMKQVERRKVFVDGDDVCIIMDFKTTLDELANTPLALWATVHDGRIVRLELFYDTGAYSRMFES